MFHELGIKRIKDAAVAIGLIDKTEGRLPKEILGSGLFINSSGYVTAKHAIDECDIRIKDSESQQLEIAILSVTTNGLRHLYG